MNSPSEKVDKQEKGLKVNLLSEAQNIFIEKNLGENISFFDSLNKSDIFEKFKSFLNKNSKFKELGVQVVAYNTEQQNSLADQIIDEKNKILFSRNRNLSILEKILSKEYEKIDLDQVRKETSKLGLLELKKILKSDFQRRNFLKKIGVFESDENLKKSRKQDEKNLLENIGISKTNFDNLEEDLKQAIFEAFNKPKKLTFSDLEAILNVISDEKSKKNLLKYFVSTISVEDLEKTGLLNSKIKSKILKSIETDLRVSEAEAKEIYNSLEKSEIFLETDELEDLDFSKLLKNKTIQKNILDEYNYEIEDDSEEEQELLNLDEKGNIHENFIKFVKNSDKISPEIKNQIDLFKKGNFFEIKDDKKNGFYHIKDVDRGNTASSKTIILENISSKDGIKKVGNGKDEIFTYSKILKLFEKISSDSDKHLQIQFFTPESLKKSGIRENIDSSSEINSYEDLVNGLDLINPEGKGFGLTTDTTIISSKDDIMGKFVYILKDINKSSKVISIFNGKGIEKVSFRDFYSIIKKDSSKLKRGKKLNNLTEAVSGISSIKGFGNLKVKGGKIIDSKNDPLGKFPIDSFIGEGGKKLLKIEKISDGMIEYSIGNLKEEKKSKKVTRTLENAFKSDNFSQFVEDIKLFELQPEYNPNIKEKKEGKELERSPSLISKFLSGLSIAEIIGSGEFLIDSIKKKLERGNRLKSLKFAMKFSGVLGEDMKLYLKSSQEQEEKSLTEELKEHLKNMNSGPMIDKIILILKNKDSEMYEKIAALLAISKYGNLYVKDLKPYAGSFLWYKALGGTESFKMKFKEKCNKDGSSFTEEDLVFSWLNELGKKGIVRSKLYKDFKKELSNGESDEIEAGKRDCSEKATYTGRFEHTIGLLKDREYAGFLGAIESLSGKSPEAKDYQAAGFIFAVSGYGTFFGDSLINKFNALSYTTPCLSYIYGTSEDRHKKYKDFIRALLKNAPDFKNTSALSDFEAIYKHKEGPVVGAKIFWEQYREKLVKYLNFENALVALKANEIPEFGSYYKMAKDTWTDKEYAIAKEKIEIGLYKNNSIGLAGDGKMLQHITLNQQGDFGNDASKEAFEMYMKTFKGIKDGEGSLEQKRELFRSAYEPFERRLADLFGRYIDKEAEKNPAYVKLKNNGLDLVKSVNKPVDYNFRLDRIFDNFIGNVSVGEFSDHISLKIDDVLATNTKTSSNKSKKESANDEDYLMSA